ncbi:hypothetical protein I79_001810 [Cricetulus griseus]|uniref:Uncharacterized protein n=1 Tax=Cricetulus griseus TaxID=10029 RepID=G3GVR3_CRIGR|nr:hypothetical protein I79_001810 [Cricetulus griseus]
MLKTVPLLDRIFKGHHQLLKNRGDSVPRTKELIHHWGKVNYKHVFPGCIQTCDIPWWLALWGRAKRGLKNGMK